MAQPSHMQPNHQAAVDENTRLRSLLHAQKSFLRLQRLRGKSAMGGSSAIVSTLLGLVGIIATALLTYYFTSRQDDARTLATRKGDAYVLFLKALDKGRMAGEMKDFWSTTLQKELPEAERGWATREAASAHAKLMLEFELEGGAAIRQIAVYGDKSVVHAVAEWMRVYKRPRAVCDDVWAADLTTWLRMRESVLGADQQAMEEDMVELSLPCNPSDEQKKQKRERDAKARPPGR